MWSSPLKSDLNCHWKLSKSAKDKYQHPNRRSNTGILNNELDQFNSGLPQYEPMILQILIAAHGFSVTYT
nr:unnamed protein product [Spirometra erinaceieuropaei]